MKKFKKALICSLFSMMFCTSMFVGTTYAWFTDEVTVPTNQIVAGNLDIELYAENPEATGEADKYKVVDKDTKLFKENILWEPGHVEVVSLKVANVGSLALKYQVGINVAKETPGKNVAGNKFYLSEHIKFAFFDGSQTFENREAAVTAAEAASPVTLKTGISKTDIVLYPTAKATTENPAEKIMTLVVYMPEEVDNVANYRETKPSIDLGIKFLATQAQLEEDSFGSDYDSSATYPTSVNA